MQLGLQSADSLEPPTRVRNLESSTPAKPLVDTDKKIDAENEAGVKKQEAKNICIANSKDDVVKFLVGVETKTTSASGHNCSSESMSFDYMFRHDHPIDTSSLRSESSSVSDASQGSPRKSPKKSRIAAKFNIPIDTTSVL